MGLFYLSIMIALIVLCAPRTGYGQADYLAAIAAASCSNGAQPISVVGGAGNIISDVFILILPLPAIWRLHLRTAKKIGITAIIMTGLA